jgi:hypothetical protein
MRKHHGAVFGSLYKAQASPNQAIPTNLTRVWQPVLELLARLNYDC